MIGLHVPSQSLKLNSKMLDAQVGLQMFVIYCLSVYYLGDLSHLPRIPKKPKPVKTSTLESEEVAAASSQALLDKSGGSSSSGSKIQIEYKGKRLRATFNKE